ncbi:MAG: aldo/keto reductase [Bacteroidales bacterium]|nr:aldo/keto reductase [Bacteroidales bacterium]MBR1434975.1 aldo/keto reductase [Bacteroidales bacterium]
MKSRRLGNFEVSAVGLGCMGMSHAYGAPADRKEMRELLAFAVDNGVTLFDTAEVYGTHDDPHHNETLVGEALSPFRDKVAISSKFGLRFDYSSKQWNLPVIADSSPEAIRRSIEGSLSRLKTDHIDIYFQHRIDPSVEPETVAQVMADLIREGKILHWGVSEASPEYIRRAHAVTPLSAIQNRYSMMARWHESLFPMLEELGIGYMAFSPLANGLLSKQYDAGCSFDKATDYRAGMPQFKEESFEANRNLFDLIDGLAEKYKATPAQISLSWMLCKKPYIVPIPGTRKFFRLKENIGAADIDISKEEVAEIDRKLDSIPMSEVYGGTKVIKK